MAKKDKNLITEIKRDDYVANIVIGKINFSETSQPRKNEVNANMEHIKLCPLGKVSKKIRKKAEKPHREKRTRSMKRDQSQSKSWVILNKSQGENFALQNLKNDDTNDLFVKGMPEAGKKEPWNIIKIKQGKIKPLVKKEENHYILDDFDTLKEIVSDAFDRKKADGKQHAVLGKEKFVTSPYVLNLRKDFKEKKEGGEKSGILNFDKGFVESVNQKKNSMSAFWENFHFGRPDKASISPKVSLNAGEGNILKKQGTEELSSKSSQKIKDRFGGFKVYAFIKEKIAGEKSAASEVDDPDFEPENLRLAPVLSFALVALFLALPVLGTGFYLNAKNIQGRVFGDAEEAVNNLRLGKDLLSNTSLGEAKQKFSKAEDSFDEAQSNLKKLDKSIYDLAFTLFDKKEELKTANALTEAGKNVAEISNIFLSGLEGLNWQSKSDPSGTSTLGAIQEDKQELKTGKILDFITRFNSILTLSAPHFKNLKSSIDRINKDVIPEQYKKNFQEIESLVNIVQSQFYDYERYSKILLELVAKDGEKRYLFLFQNNNEIRPTGGFIGSYALVDIKNGEIKNMEIPGEGSYYLQGGLLKNLEPPRPLRLINSRWEFQDANWWPDFPTAVQDITNIYEKSGGPTVDGVIAVNASGLKDLFQTIGPVELSGYNKTIDADNFFEEIQKEVELGYDKKENRPKQIITELAPIVLQRIFSLEDQKYLDLVKIFERALLRRDIQIFSRDENLEKEILELGWGGEIKDIKNRDYLAVIDTNIGGRKTDSVIETSIKHETTILNDGSITDELFITKKHQGIKGDVFTGVNNVNYLRVYVPKGSILLEAEGFDPPPESSFKELRENSIKDNFLSFSESAEKIDMSSETVIGEMFGKTYFANWTQVNPGEERIVRIKYKLPFSILDSGIGKYSLYIQKQSGSKDFTIIKKLKYPENYNVIWAYPESPNLGGEWIKDDFLGNDKFYGAVFTNL